VPAGPLSPWPAVNLPVRQYGGTVTLADTPTTWTDPAPMSTLHAILFFVGIPALIVAVISLLVVTPSLVKGQRYRPGREWGAEPEWLNAPEGVDVKALEAGDAALGRRAVESGPHTSQQDSGGASATW
jgi:hypothetical protein